MAVPVALAGCFNPFDPRELGPGISTQPPVPDSPSNLLRLLQWSYNNRAIAEYRELFTADYRFAFSALDPYGDPFNEQDPWSREDEIVSATHLFEGGHANQPPASSITLNLDRNFNVQNDNRPNKNDRMHKRIRTTVTLTIVTTDAPTQVTGAATFYVTRGDVAAIPEELLDLGFKPDSTRWYIERWEDDTAVSGPGGGGGVAAARPATATPTPSGTRTITWGALKVIYLGVPLSP